MIIAAEQLKAFLLDSGLVLKSDIEDGENKAQKENKDLGTVLVEEGKLSKDDLIHLQGYILGMPFVNLIEEKIPKEILEIVPEPIAKSHNIVAYGKNGDVLEVAMLNPQDLEAIEFIKKKTNFKILARLTDLASMKYVLSQYQKGLAAEFKEIIGREASGFQPIKIEGEKEIPEEDLKKAAQDLPVVKIVDTLIRHAILQRASDIHIEPMENEVLARYRIDGILRDAMVLPKKISSSVVARIKVLSNLRLDERRLPQDGRFKIETPEEKVSFRVSILPTYYGEKVVLRLLVESAKGFTLESLGFSNDNIDKLHKAIRKPVGMVLATGPTGSGKTTALYTVLDILNTPEVNISTIEDPIEYQIPRINQTQVKPDIGYTFANGLRSLLRQDPNVIMVGEIRDNETASLAVNASLTGHLVLSTLHTNSAAGAIPRLIDMKVEPFLIASTLEVIIAQRLVRKLCKNAKSYKPPKRQIDDLSKEINLEKVLETLRKERIIKPEQKIEDVEFFEPQPSGDCPDGYSDRVGIHEVLEVTQSVKNLIINRASAEEIERRAKSEGMLTMFEDGFVKAAKGITSLEEVLRVTKIE